MIQDLISRDFSSEFRFSATRSSGPGGQHVNKVSTRMELRFDVTGSSLLSEEEKSVVLEKLVNRINALGELIIVSQSERSQLQNKEKTVEKFYLLLSRALTPKKKRRPTRPTRASVEQRLETKRRLSEKKDNRKDV